MEISTETWTWLILGGVLLVSEIFTGTFHLLFFGIAALVTAAVAQWLWPSLVGQVGTFGVLALASVLFVQKRLPRNQAQGFDADVAQVIVLSNSLKAGQEGTIQYQGAPWTAVNLSAIDLEKGRRVRIARTEGVRIFVQAVEDSK